MKDRGKALEMVTVAGNLGGVAEQPGLWLFVVKDGASRHDLELLREILGEVGINSLLVLESALKEIRHFDVHELTEIKAAVNEALGTPEVPLAAATKVEAVVTPERVVKALERRPGLLAAVHEILANRYGEPPPNIADMEGLFSDPEG